jgi:hypothetical protein
MFLSEVFIKKQFHDINKDRGTLTNEIRNKKLNVANENLSIINKNQFIY